MFDYEKIKHFLLNQSSIQSEYIVCPVTTGQTSTKDNPVNESVIEKHLKGEVRYGVKPDIDNKAYFGVIDIDLKDKSDSEKLNIANNIAIYFLEKLGLKLFIEISKSKGYHLWLFFEGSFSRGFIKKLLEEGISAVTSEKIANGCIEVFPKGTKGNAVFFPFFGSFDKEEKTSPNYLKGRKTVFVNNLGNIIPDILDQINEAKYINSDILRLLEELKKYPPCFLGSYIKWNSGSRDGLSCGLAGICKKVLNFDINKATEIILNIAEAKADEESGSRIAAIDHTYKIDNPAGCTILQGTNKDISIIEPVCLETNCKYYTKVNDIQRFILRPDDLKEIKDPEYLVSEMFPRGQVGMLFGKGGLGKTWLSMDLAIELSKGGFIFGNYKSVPRKILFMVGDFPTDFFKKRLDKFSKLPNNANFALVNKIECEEEGKSFSISDIEGQKNVEDIIKFERPDLIILDTFISFFDKDENEAKDIKFAFNFLRRMAKRYSCHILINHHPRKSNNDSKPRKLDQSDLIGSSAFSRLAYCVLAVDSAYEEEGEEKDGVGLVHCVKSWERKLASFVFTINDIRDFEGNSKVELTYDYSSVSTYMKQNPLNPIDRVKSHIKMLVDIDPSKVTRSEVVEYFEANQVASENTVKRAFASMVKDSELKMIRNGNNTYYTGKYFSEEEK